MSFFEQFKDSQKVLSLERPCLYSGKEILEHSKLILHNLITEREINSKIKTNKYTKNSEYSFN